MRFGILTFLAALAVGMIAVAADVSTANAQACRKNYYRCDLNRGGRIDPANSYGGAPFHVLPEEFLQMRFERRWTS